MTICIVLIAIKIVWVGATLINYVSSGIKYTLEQSIFTSAQNYHSKNVFSCKGLLFVSCLFRFQTWPGVASCLYSGVHWVPEKDEMRCWWALPYSVPYRVRLHEGLCMDLGRRWMKFVLPAFTEQFM